MMDYVLMLVSVFVNVAASSFNNKFAKKQLVGPADNYIFNLVFATYNTIHNTLVIFIIVFDDKWKFQPYFFVCFLILTIRCSKYGWNKDNLSIL